MNTVIRLWAVAPAMVDFDGIKIKNEVGLDDSLIPRMVTRVGNVDVISVSGTMSKFSWWGCNTVKVRAALRKSSRDTEVKGIVLKITSPGGSVDGMGELCSEIKKASALKRTVAFIEDLGASAAYWAASQTAFIGANKLSQSGSIGTMTLLVDDSKYYEDLGIKIHLVATGDKKGQGAPGQEVTQEEIDSTKKTVMEFNNFFLEDVANGRKMSMKKVKEIATGEVFLAAEAKAKGLIDSISDFETFLANFMNSLERRRKQSQSINQLKLVKARIKTE